MLKVTLRRHPSSPHTLPSEHGQEVFRQVGAANRIGLRSRERRLAPAEPKRLPLRCAAAQLPAQVANEGDRCRPVGQREADVTNKQGQSSEPDKRQTWREHAYTRKHSDTRSRRFLRSLLPLPTGR